MKKILKVKASDVKVKPFILDDFTQNKAAHGSIKKVTKKELRTLAENLDLKYSDSEIVFAKKMMTAYLKTLDKNIR